MLRCGGGGPRDLRSGGTFYLLNDRRVTVARATGGRGRRAFRSAGVRGTRVADVARHRTAYYNSTARGCGGHKIRSQGRGSGARLREQGV